MKENSKYIFVQWRKNQKVGLTNVNKLQENLYNIQE
jgi:hypothetical protein